MSNGVINLDNLQKRVSFPQIGTPSARPIMSLEIVCFSNAPTASMFGMLGEISYLLGHELMKNMHIVGSNILVRSSHVFLSQCNLQAGL